MISLISYIWQLPQHIIGFILTRFCEPIDDVWVWRFKSAVSLGKYIVMRRKHSDKTYKHEHGHSKQSIILGPLYLIIIGIPSVIGNIVHRFIKFNYYKQPWEWWADKLGGVVR